jgi:hypothetical protein
VEVEKMIVVEVMEEEVMGMK